MVKSDIIKILQNKYEHIDKNKISDSIDFIFEKISSTLENHNLVTFRGFGCFTVRFRKTRKGRNPNTGEALYTKNKYVPFFKAGKKMKEIVNFDLGDKYGK